jgi:hypothetical protein
MTQTDLASGFLICEVGMAPVNPSESVVFRMLIRFASDRKALAMAREACWHAAYALCLGGSFLQSCLPLLCPEVSSLAT